MGKVYRKRFLKGTLVYEETNNGAQTERFAIGELASLPAAEQERLIHEAMMQRRTRRHVVIYR